MGRRKSAWLGEPPRFQPRRLPSGKILYYYQSAGSKIPLGADRAAALKEWARLEAGEAKVNLFPEVSKFYRASTFPGFRVSTQEHYETALANLDVAFERFTLDQIEPKHVKAYMRKRSKKGAAIFEKRVGSALFNWARQEGHTAVANPFRGVKFSQAEKRAYDVPAGERERYVTDEEFDQVHASGDDILQDAMDLALLGGQRPGDILKARRQDIVAGVLWFVQEKTGKRLGLRVEGDLARVLERILARKRPSIYLIADRRGQRVSYNALNDRFCKARGAADWQFRDIRAKAATDSPDLKRAQELLGHANETTTTVYRRAKSDVVSPLKRQNLEPI